MPKIAAAFLIFFWKSVDIGLVCFHQDNVQCCFDMAQILKKICDHPLLLTKRAAEDVLEEMDTMLKPEEVNMAEKLAMYIADSADTDGFEENHVNISCKISFILSLLVRENAVD